MTTARHRPGGVPLLGVVIPSAAVAGAAAAAVAALAASPQVGVTALVGALAAVLGLTLGCLITGAVATMTPQASLPVALLTYAIQVGLVTVVLAALATRIDREAMGWAAGAVVVVALAWTVAHLVAATRQRLPLYDLPATGSANGSVDRHVSRPGPVGGGPR